MEQPIYEEEFVKSHVLADAREIAYVLDQIQEVHSKEHGWVVSEPAITMNPDGKTVTLKVKLSKYDIKSKVGRSM